MDITRWRCRAPAVAGTAVDSALGGGGIRLDVNAVGNGRVMHVMNHTREAGGGKSWCSSREIGTGSRTVAVTAALQIGGGIALDIARGNSHVTGKCAHRILAVIVIMIMTVLALVAVRTVVADRMMLVMLGCS